MGSSLGRLRPFPSGESHAVEALNGHLFLLLDAGGSPRATSLACAPVSGGPRRAAALVTGWAVAIVSSRAVVSIVHTGGLRLHAADVPETLHRRPLAHPLQRGWVLA